MDTQVVTTDDISTWFNNLIELFKEDFKQIKLGIAEPEKTDFYEAAMNNDYTKLSQMTRDMSNRHFIQLITKSYISELKSNKCSFSVLAFDLNNDEILVWAVIDDNDEASEDLLWLTEAKINAQFHQYGFTISTTIIEKSDNIDVPSHYKIVN